MNALDFTEKVSFELDPKGRGRSLPGQRIIGRKNKHMWRG